MHNHSVKLPRKVHSARSEALALPRASNIRTSSWSSLGLICPRVSSEITVEVILCKYSRQPEPTPPEDTTMLRTHPAVSECWAEAPIKIARMTLTIKLDGNWSSFQLANNTPPLSVTGSVIAPSARMRAYERCGPISATNAASRCFILTCASRAVQIHKQFHTEASMRSLYGSSEGSAT